MADFREEQHQKNCSFLQLRINSRKKHLVDFDFGTLNRSNADLTSGTESPRIERAKSAFADLYKDIVTGLQNDPKELFLSKMPPIDQSKLIVKYSDHSFVPITESTWPLFLGPIGIHC